MTSYDPAVIRKFAQLLYARASTIVMVNSLIGVLIGGVVGKFMFDSFGMIVLAAAGGGIGYFLGLQKAFILKLQAQTSMCQVQIEENTRSSTRSSSAAVQPSHPARHTMGAVPEASPGAFPQERVDNLS